MWQYEEAVDAELAWVGETERKLASLGPLSLEPDVTVAQLQVQRAFNIDIIRHKDTVDQLLHTREDILESCSEQQREALKVRGVRMGGGMKQCATILDCAVISFFSVSLLCSLYNKCKFLMYKYAPTLPSIVNFLQMTFTLTAHQKPN